MLTTVNGLSTLRWPPGVPALPVPDVERPTHAPAVDGAAIDQQARRYLSEPGDAPWDEVVRALRGAIGHSEADDLLRAIEIRLRTARRL